MSGTWEDKEHKREQKERKREEKDAKRKLKSGNGERRPHKSVQEVLRGSQYDRKYRCFMVLAILGAVRGRFRDHVRSFLEQFWEAFWVRSSAESRNVEDRSRSSWLEREALLRGRKQKKKRRKSG